MSGTITKYFTGILTHVVDQRCSMLDDIVGRSSRYGLLTTLYLLMHEQPMAEWLIRISLTSLSLLRQIQTPSFIASHPEGSPSNDLCVLPEPPRGEVAEEHGEPLAVDGRLLLHVGRVHSLEVGPPSPVAGLVVPLLCKEHMQMAR